MVNGYWLRGDLLPYFLHVGLELALEVGGGGEGLLSAQVAEEVDAEGLAVEVGVVVEEVDFYALLGEGAEGGAVAYIEHAEAGGAIVGDGDADGVGSVARQELEGVGGLDVGGGEAEAAAYALAVGDGAGEAVGSAEELVGEGYIAVGERLAYG